MRKKIYTALSKIFSSEMTIGIVIGAILAFIGTGLWVGLGDTTYSVETLAFQGGFVYTVVANSPLRHHEVFKTTSPEQAWGIWFGLNNNIKMFQEQGQSVPVPPAQQNRGGGVDPNNPGLTQKSPPEVIR